MRRSSLKARLNSKARSFSLDSHAAGVEQLLGTLGYDHLRARVYRKTIVVLSGPEEDPHTHVRLRHLRGEEWGLDFPTSSGRWERGIEGPRGNVIAWLHQDFPWVLADIGDGG